jgi:hypothetical protein
VATPRPDRNERKSTVGPAVVAPRPPAHSIWATLRPSRSAAWAIVSAWRTPASKAAVRFANGCPLMWNVLFVEPVTAGQAPVASVYHPAPVFGGAWVSRPLSAAAVPFLRNEAVGTPPTAAYLATMSWRSPSAAKKMACATGAGAPGALIAGAPLDPDPSAVDGKTRARTSTATARPNRGRMDVTGAPPWGREFGDGRSTGPRGTPDRP